MVLPLIAALVLAAIAVGIARNPTVYKVAVRSFLRRPGQSVLVITGLLVASMVLASSFVAADLQEAMFEDNVYRAWGPVDLVVGSISGQVFGEDVGRRAIDISRIKDFSDGRSVRLELPASAQDETRGTLESQINLIGIDPALDASLAAFEPIAGGPDPSAGMVVINERLAKRLGAEIGDVLKFNTVTLEANPVSIPLTLGGIARNTGKANWQLRPNAFVLLSDLQSATKGTGFINQVVLSAGGEDRSPKQVDALKDASVVGIDALVGVPHGNPDDPRGFRIARAKSQALENSHEQSRFFRSLLGFLGGLVAITSIALIVNLFVMLGEERRSELGTMRALGLKRGGLMLLGLMEGVLYSVAAAAAGAVVGGFLGRYLAGAMIDVFTVFAADAAIEFTKQDVELKVSTLLIAGSGGFLVSLASVAAVSRRTSRLSVVAAIRGLPEARRRRLRRNVQFMLIVAGGLAGAAGIFAEFPILKVLGGTVFIVGCSALLGRAMIPRAAATLSSSLTIAFGFYSYVFLPNFEDDLNTGFAVTMIAAVIITIAAVVLISANLKVFERLTAFFGSRTRAVVRAATAYSVGYRFRTAMTMGMFAIVLFMVGAFAIWGGFGQDIAQQSGGFDVFVRSSFPVRNFTDEGASELVGMFSTRYEGGYVVGDAPEVTFPIALFGVDERMGEFAEFEFSDMPKGLTEAEVWDQLASRADAAILDTGTNPGGRVVGDSLELRTDAGLRKFEVIGVVNESFLQGILVSKRAFAELYPNRATDSAWLVGAEQGVDPLVMSQRLESAFPGVDAGSIREILAEIAEGQRAFVAVFQVLLKLGVVIGISGLAIGSIRTVLERRQSIGILRALGFRRGMVGSWLLTEALMVATLGCAIGLTTGLVGTYLLIGEQIPDVSFSADWPQITSTLGVIYLATAIFTALPAWRAANLKPAEAVRYVE